MAWAPPHGAPRKEREGAAARCGSGFSARQPSRAKSMLRSPRRQIDNLGSALALAPHGGRDALADGLVGGPHRVGAEVAVSFRRHGLCVP